MAMAIQIIDPLKSPVKVKGSIVSVGNFDGVHAGHAILVREVVKRARQKNLASVIVTFEPHTRHVLSGGAPVPLLSTLGEKTVLLEQLGVDLLAVVPFDTGLAVMAPRRFVETVLIGALSAREWVLGDTHTFGRSARGNKNLLHTMVSRNHFSVLPSKLLIRGSEVVSSTRIRERIFEGRIEEAVKMLGHPYLIKAERAEGAHRGASLGFPTVNFRAPKAGKVLPPAGVYAARLQRNRESVDGALYFGSCPTFGGEEPHLEFHALAPKGADPAPASTGLLWVHGFIRADRKFDGAGALAGQMKKDVAAIQQFFSQE
jgi:riboflavin kinase/FMN adenylyltransferase